MAHFAELDENNIVIRTIVVNNEDILDDSGNESEQKGIDFCANLFGGKWLQTSINGNIRANFAIPGMHYCPNQDVFHSTLPPGPWAKLSDSNEWIADFPINIHTGEPFTHDELCWLFYYIRNTKSYRFCPAVPKDPNDPFLFIACTSTDFMYPTFEGLMYGSNRSQQIAEAKIEGDKIVIPFVHTLRKEVDLTPLGIVLEVRWEGLNPDIAADSLNAHPQTASRTRQELFRLIIEWAYCHTEFGNNEPAATTCHNILRQVQMPLDVRNELLTEIEPQAVECFIRGIFPFRNTDFGTLADPPSPPLFTEWYQNLRMTYPPLSKDIQELKVSLDSLPVDYPM